MGYESTVFRSGCVRGIVWHDICIPVTLHRQYYRIVVGVVTFFSLPETDTQLEGNSSDGSSLLKIESNRPGVQKCWTESGIMKKTLRESHSLHKPANTV